MGVKSYSIASEQWGWLEYDLKSVHKRRTSIRRDARKASKTLLDFWKETKNIVFELVSLVLDRVYVYNYFTIYFHRYGTFIFLTYIFYPTHIIFVAHTAFVTCHDTNNFWVHWQNASCIHFSSRFSHSVRRIVMAGSDTMTMHINPQYKLIIMF